MSEIPPPTPSNQERVEGGEKYRTPSRNRASPHTVSPPGLKPFTVHECDKLPGNMRHTANVRRVPPRRVSALLVRRFGAAALDESPRVMVYHLHFCIWGFHSPKYDGTNLYRESSESNKKKGSRDDCREALRRRVDTIYCTSKRHTIQAVFTGYSYMVCRKNKTPRFPEGPVPAWAGGFCAGLSPPSSLSMQKATRLSVLERLRNIPALFPGP